MCIFVGGLLTVVGVSLICLAPGSPAPITRPSESELRLVFQRASLRIGDDPTDRHFNESCVSRHI